ncbi:MAG TPA: selenocysteine-specific translation elongation factor [Thermoanaerobaculia bacterium]|nr:selenocysteine-specific translation elongation factor [Thermoanaerobaculia bacterium]
MAQTEAHLSPSPRRVVVGTAGHIDHGKTALVEALTGINCDRWEEERVRGITIDLGFAHLTEGDVQLGFVDVPGHERFVHNALAGLGGIDLMVLVVAADEGVMPQTREHLAICALLGIPAGIVALTKIDLVDHDLRDVAALELTDALARTTFAGAPIVPVSSTTGEGVATLRETLVSMARAVERPAERALRPARLPIDRAFHLRGLGVLVTGTLTCGRIAVQDRLELLPARRETRVRSVQVHGQDRERAEAGERTALQLTGVELDAVERGTQLTAPGAYSTSTSLLARLELLPEAPQTLRGWRDVRFHLFSSEVLGRLRPLQPPALEPGGRALVEIRLAAPVTAARGDRFVVRRLSPQTTLGGGVVLDPEWQRLRGARLAPALAAFGGTEAEAILHWVRAAGEAGVTAAELARKLGSLEGPVAGVLERAKEAGAILAARGSAAGPERWISAAVYERVARRAPEILDQYFRRDRLATGMPKAEAIRRLLPAPAAPLAEVYLGWLAEQKILVVGADLVDLPGRGAVMNAEESDLSERVMAAFEQGGLAPPSPSEINQALGAKQQTFDAVLRYLYQRKRLARLPQGLFIAQSQLDRLADELGRSRWTRFSVPEFKERFGLTRKWAIPLLEHLDQIGRTRRVGDQREVVRK